MSETQQQQQQAPAPAPGTGTGTGQGFGAGRGFGRARREGGDDRREGGKDGAGRGAGRGDGKAGGPRGPRGPRRGQEEKWVPLTKLGRLVQAGKITSIEVIFRFSIPIKEFQIVDHFLKDKLKEEPLSIFPVQKQTTAGQRTRFKAYVCLGDYDGHIGLGWKSAKEVQGAIKGAIIHAKLNLIPVRRGYWGNKIAKPHTVPCKVTGKGGSVRLRLIPAPRGSDIVAAGTSKKVLQMAGIHDCYTASRGSTRTRSNFLKATFNALEQTYKFLNPDFWGKQAVEPTPLEKEQKFFLTGEK